MAVATVALTSRSLALRLPAAEDSAAVATQLATRGLVWAVRQETSLLLRHWWPAAVLTASFSPTVRRALLTAVLVDLAVFLRERSGVHPLTALLARRLDDVAYGSGLWWGALRSRSLQCLAPRPVRHLGGLSGRCEVGRDSGPVAMTSREIEGRS